MALAQPKLPAAQQRKREQMQAKADAAKPPAPAAGDAPAPPSPPAPPAAGDAPAPPAPETVTIPASELQELRTNAERATAESLRAEAAHLDLEDARTRLTELETTRKQEPAVPVELDLGFTDADAALSAEELEEYGAAEGTIRKIVRQEIAAAMRKYDTHLSPRLTKAEQRAEQATTVVTQSNQKRFMDVVKEKAPDVNTLVVHPAFNTFLRSFVPRTRMTYNQALEDAHKVEDLQGVLDIFDDFRTSAKITKPSTSGYNSGNPTGATGEPTPAPAGKRFSITERKKKSEDYRKGRISREDLDAFMVEFNKALAEDRIDP